jgi:hypothetical protein
MLDGRTELAPVDASPTRPDAGTPARDQPAFRGEP